MLSVTTSPVRLAFEIYICAGSAAGIEWSPMRKALLRVLWSAVKPIGAYELAAYLRRQFGKSHPTVVYRCLEQFLDARLIVQIITWRRYLISPDPADWPWAALLCMRCKSATLIRIPGATDALARRSANLNFTPKVCWIEGEGQCRQCTVVRSPTHEGVLVRGIGAA